MYELLALPHSPGVIQAPYAVPKGSSRAQIQGQGSVVLLKDPKNRTCKKKNGFVFLVSFVLGWIFLCLFIGGGLFGFAFDFVFYETKEDFSSRNTFQDYLP